MKNKIIIMVERIEKEIIDEDERNMIYNWIEYHIKQLCHKRIDFVDIESMKARQNDN